MHAFNARIDNGKDIFIPIAGKREFKNGLVSYRTDDGKITFQAFTRSLRCDANLNNKSSMQNYLKNILNLINSKSGSGNEPRPLSSGEFLIDTSIVPVPAPYFQDEPAIAFDGTNYLVVWVDWRTYTDIYCARVSPAGIVLDPAGIQVTNVIGYQNNPRVSFDGTNYLIVWQDERRGYYSDLYGARVSKDGNVLDPNGFAISLGLDVQWFPKVGFDGTNYLVVWQDYRNQNFDIYGARVSPAGAVLDPTGIALSSKTDNEVGPSLIFGGSNFLLVWETWYSMVNSDLFCARVSQSGTNIDQDGIIVCNALFHQNQSSVSFDGTNYFTVWVDSRDTVPDIYGARINQSGVVLDPNGFSISSAQNNQFSPCVTFGGNNFLVVWEDYRTNDTVADIYGSRVSQTGANLDPGGIIISNFARNQYQPCVSYAGTEFLVVWADYRLSNFDCAIYSTRVSQSGTVLDPNGLLISTCANEQRKPVVAFDGTNYLVVWEDHCKGDTSDIFGARITSAGGILDPTHLVISSAVNSQTAPAVVFDGTNYLVVWSDKRSGTEDIYGARVNQSGVVLDPNGFTISSAINKQVEPKVAFDGNNYLVVWEDCRTSDTTPNIYGARVSQTGIILDPVGFVIRADSGEHFAPAVAFDGLNYLVVWQDDNRTNDWDNILGVLVSPAGLLDTIIIPICTRQMWQYSPSVAFDGVNYLVAWADARNLVNDMDIYCARVNPSGVVIDQTGIPVSTNNCKQVSPSATFDGTNFLITWEDYRNGYYSDIYGARLNRSGELIGIFPVSNKKGNQAQPAVAQGSNGQVLIAYSGWTDIANYKNFNSMRIWGTVHSGTDPVANIGWSRKANVTGAEKNIKDGACITALNDKVYALVGNNTRDLMVYDISNNTWTKKSEVPFSAITGKEKRVKKGGCITNDGYFIYVVKGNNTKEFYRYDPESNTWQELPQPNFEKGIKGGSMVFDGESKIYLIGGSNRNEWKVFDIYSDTWGIPGAPSLPADKWKYGSFIVYTGDTIFGLRVGGKTNEFYRLVLTSPAWTRVKDMPLYSVSGKKKKAKKGSCGTFNGDFIYALKGGNTYEYYSYDIDEDSWTQKENIGQPNGYPAKKVKGGGSLAYSSLAGGIFALVGNNNNEFWFYLQDQTSIGYPAKGAMSQTNDMKKDFSLKISPNPCHQSAVIHYNLPASTSARIKIFNVSGKLVHYAFSDNQSFLVKTRSMPAGVYILKFESGDYVATKKLLVAH